MGKKRSNQNTRRRQKQNKNILQNPCVEKEANSVLDQNTKKVKNSCKNKSIRAQKGMLDTELPCLETISNTQKSNQNISLVKNYTVNKDALKNSCGTVSYDTKINNLSEEICRTTMNKPRNGNQNSSFTHMHGIRPVTVSPHEITEPVTKDPFPLKYREENNSLSESDEEYQILYSTKKSTESGGVKPKSGFQTKIPNSMPNKYDDELMLCSILFSDEEHSTSEFFQPVFHDSYDSTKFKNKVPLKDNSYYAENILSSEASSLGFRKSRVKSDFEDRKEFISTSVDAYKNSKEAFLDVYRTWLPKRKDTLQKLEKLNNEIHTVQMNYYKSQVAFREVSFASCTAKTVENPAVSFLASFAAFMSDAVSGVVSVAQAFNIDFYQNKFQEIMEHDSEITQHLYKARSVCVLKYQNIEEVIRKFHSDTLSSTAGKISDTLEVSKYWEAMKSAYGKDDMPQLLNVVGKFFDNAFQPTKLEMISDSIQDYVDDNPAALEACKSAGMVACGALDTWGVKQAVVQCSSVLKSIDTAANRLRMIEYKKEIHRLKHVIEEDSPQSKLEFQIEDAIASLKSEMIEINNTYFELFKNHVDNDCDIYPLN